MSCLVLSCLVLSCTALCCVVLCRLGLRSTCGCFWGVLGRFLVVLGGLREVLRGHFGVLGGSWAALGGSWAPLGATGSRLGPSWVVRVVLGPTRPGEPRHLARFWVPKGAQDEAKIAPKRDQNRCQKRSRKKKLLKIVLESSWSDLGSFWVPSWSPKIAGNLGKRNVS